MAIITGATAGIGEETARLFVAEGARVVLVGRRVEAGKALVAALGSANALFVAGDVVDPRTAPATVRAACEMGHLDVLVNNAGIDFTSDLLETSIEDVRRVLDVNFIGVFTMLAEAARAMRGRGGSIVNVTSRTASIGIPTMSIYAASKGALLSLTRGAAVDLAQYGIRVNAVAPGLTETPMMRAWVESQSDPSVFRVRLAADIPQGRFASPGDVAAAILFLASDESGHITGASLPVDGGFTAR